MSELNKRIITSVILLIAISISFINIYIIFLTLILINFFVLDELIKIFRLIYKKNNFKFFISILSSLVYTFYFTVIIFLFLLQTFEVNKIQILFLLSICIATDIGGFLFGKIIGGKKLTKISPNKTYSGSAGSFFLAIFVGYLFVNNSYYVISLNTNIFVFVIIISFISQLGDLTISYLKRKAKIKNTGSFLPGHGGLLDRLDGILLALPFGIILITI